MSKPLGDQNRFDKNSDGRLSAGEWLNWYAWKYGVDIENQERRAARAKSAETELHLSLTFSCEESDDQCSAKREKLIQEIAAFADKVDALILSLGDPDDTCGYTKLADMTGEELLPLAHTADDMLGELEPLEPENMHSEEWQRWSHILDLLIDLRDYANDTLYLRFNE